MVELNEKDLKEIERFKTGFPWMKVEAPAVPGRGIHVLCKESQEAAVAAADAALGEGKLAFAKFIPASGAASRMFKDLYNKNVCTINKFVLNIDKFAFYDSLLYAGLEGDFLVDYTLGKNGLDYGSKPKAVLKFHKYPDGEVRTALDEQFIEANEYARGKDGKARVVVTISPEHSELFEEAITSAKRKYESRFGVKYDVSVVFQQKWTDTIAVTPDNLPFLDNEGAVLHRPGGHGALIHNLNELDADIAVIKNIDNVAVESYLPDIVWWKKVLIGTALDLRGKIFAYIDKLNDTFNEELVAEIVAFLKEELQIEFPYGLKVGKKELLDILDRPIRVCGMVKNEGEPGGGPFLIREKDGSTSLQILEGPQINPDDPHAVKCLKEATHFNPVDLVCVLKGHDGKRFDLNRYVDEDAGFISSKSYQGRELKALELPGLWNGAMSRWNTVFVEVPVRTFNPVKTVMDLLRPAHQGL